MGRRVKRKAGRREKRGRKNKQIGGKKGRHMKEETREKGEATVQPPTLAWSLWIPIVAAVLLWTSVPSVFFPCSTIQPTAVPPTRKKTIPLTATQYRRLGRLVVVRL